MSVLETAPAPLVTAPVLSAFVLPSVNLLPPELAEQARLRRLKTVLAGGLVATVGVVGALYVGALADVDEATAQVAAVSSRSSELQAQTRALGHVDDLYRQADEAEDRLAAAMGEEVRFSQFLDGLSKDVPEHVWLADITFTQTPSTASAGAVAQGPGIGTVTFTGVGFNHDDVAVWLESLAKQKGYTDPYFSNSTEALIGTRKTVNFTSTVTMTPDAYSGTYSTPAGG